MQYSTGVAFSTHAPLTVTHPTGCTDPRLAVQMDMQVEGGLTVAGLDLVSTMFPSIYVRIKTAPTSVSSNSAGNLVVYAASWLRSQGTNGLVGLQTSTSTTHASGSTVVASTYLPHFRGLYLNNPDTNGWIGTVEYSLDDTNWSFMNCLTCGGHQRAGSLVYVDVEFTGSLSNAAYCFGTQGCMFVP